MISVVIPTFNEEEKLPSCLKGIRSQEYDKEYELIVVDNNSTDKTAEIAKSFDATVVKETTQGNVFAINRGFLTAKGEIIAFTDADTTPDKNWLKAVEKAFENEKVVAITGFNKVEWMRPQDAIFALLYNLFITLTFTFNLPNLTGFNFAIRKESLEKLGGVNTKFTMSSDVEIGMRLRKIGKVTYEPRMKVRANYRRFHASLFSALKDYSKGYIFTVLLRKPPPVVQKVIREK